MLGYGNSVLPKNKTYERIAALAKRRSPSQKSIFLSEQKVSVKHIDPFIALASDLRDKNYMDLFLKLWEIQSLSCQSLNAASLHTVIHVIEGGSRRKTSSFIMTTILLHKSTFLTFPIIVVKYLKRALVNSWKTLKKLIHSMPRCIKVVMAAKGQKAITVF